MNCKHCDVNVEWAGHGKVYIDAEQSPSCGNSKVAHEVDPDALVYVAKPASPVARPEPIIHVRPKVSEGEHLPVQAVAQSGAGGAAFDADDVREDIGDAIQALRSGWPINDVIAILQECSESIKRPSSPSGQAAAPTPETHTPKDEQFWQFMEENAEIVKRWPGWKRIAAGLSAASPTGAEPLYSEQELKELGLKASTVNYGAEGSATMYSPVEPVAAEPSAEQCKCGDGECIECWPSNFTKEDIIEHAAHVTSGLRERIVKMQQTID